MGHSTNSERVNAPIGSNKIWSMATMSLYMTMPFGPVKIAA
jgi:hypothetical protein